ncbi:hypothetical protein BDV98DRAFT_596587 [Pterulicium gracile]|uniref:Uncharacterized protein n=1 Tax=Pterulicium gracile TaxID=1884261 RepID=A0A5C3Q744_9AGAR|nr:hypothetical protein BDV98DRAFT_596587 [Pterula gracilis]
MSSCASLVLTTLVAGMQNQINQMLNQPAPAPVPNPAAPAVPAAAAPAAVVAAAGVDHNGCHALNNWNPTTNKWVMDHLQWIGGFLNGCKGSSKSWAFTNLHMLGQHLSDPTNAAYPPLFNSNYNTMLVKFKARKKLSQTERVRNQVTQMTKMNNKCVKTQTSSYSPSNPNDKEVKMGN